MVDDSELFLEYAKEMLERDYLPLSLERRLRRVSALVNGVHGMFTSRQVVALVVLMWEESGHEAQDEDYPSKPWDGYL